VLILYCVYSILQSLDNFGCLHLSVEGPNTLLTEKEVLLIGRNIYQSI